MEFYSATATVYIQFSRLIICLLESKNLVAMQNY